MSEFGNRTRDIPLINDEVERLNGIIRYQQKENLLLKRHLFALEKILAERNAAWDGVDRRRREVCKYCGLPTWKLMGVPWEKGSVAAE